jgi:hypothetical protein
VRGSGDRFWGSKSGSHATVEFTQGRLASMQRLCNHPEGHRNSVLDLSFSGPELKRLRRLFIPFIIRSGAGVAMGDILSRSILQNAG